MTRRRLLLTLLAGAAVTLGCADRAAGPAASGAPGRVSVRASVAGTPVAALAVEVTAPDLPAPVIANLALANGAASGTITVPAGAARTITLHAYDAAGAETHRGARTIAVSPGANPAVSITLLPLAGAQPIQAVIGGAIVTVTPAAPSALAAGQTLQLSVTVTGSDGSPVSSPQIRWASLNATVASVSDAGLVTARAAGTTQIVAAYGNYAGAATLVVQ